MLNSRPRAAPLSDQALVSELRRHAGAHTSDAVVLVGGGNAGLMAELCRRGFAQVCLVVAPCPLGAGTADVIWVPRAVSENLASKLRGLSRSLRTGGAVVLHGDPALSGGRVASLRRLLHAEGFEAVRQVTTAGGFCLIGRKPSRPHQLLLAA